MKDINEIYYLSEEREKELWETCVFVFDNEMFQRKLDFLGF